MKEPKSQDLLVNYKIENYGETAPFIVKSSEIDEEQIYIRKNRSGMPIEFMSKGGKDFKWNLYSSDTEYQRKLVNAFTMKFQDFKREGRGLYIYSNKKGSGKTMLACCIANEIIDRYDTSVKFISANDYLELVKDSKNEDTKDKIYRLFDTSLLIIDDLSNAILDKQWTSNNMYRLIKSRSKNMLPTIYTSNVTVDNLKCTSEIIAELKNVPFDLHMPEIDIRSQLSDQFKEEFLSHVM